MPNESSYSPLMRITALAVIITFTMLILEPTAVAAKVLVDEHIEAVAETARVEAAKLTKTLQTVETTLQTWQKQLNTRQRRPLPIQTQAQTLKQQVIAFDKSVQADFTGILAHIKQQPLPQAIVQRHFDTVAQYQQDLNTLLKNLEAIITTQDETELNTHLETTLQHLQPLLASGHHPHFDPNNLPFNIPKGEVRAPLEEEKALKSLLPAETAAQNRVRKPAKAPDESYLSPTEDVQITPEIQVLAQELEHKPVAIYNWVHDNIQFIPTYGSIQGSQLTLENKAGNATDTASLLIALLRASGIHARYVYGTVKIPMAKVMNWVGGVTSPDAAIQILGQGGIPISGVIQGGQIAFLKMEHVWVDAWVDYRPSRGARHRKGDSWIPMDASFKQYQFTEGMDIQSNVSFDAEGFVQQLTQNAQINEQEGWVSGIDQNFVQTTLENYQTQIANYIVQSNPEATVGEVIGTQTIIPSKRPTLAAGLPYRVVAKGNKVRELPASFRLQFRYNLYASETDRVRGYDPIVSFQASLPNLASKRLTLSFEPATDADRQLIESYLPEVPEGQELDPATLPTSLPGYLIKLKAELKIDGEVVQSGGYFSLGQELSSASAITIVPGRWLPAYDKPIAGSFYAIGIDGQGISPAQLEAVKTRMETVKTKLETQQFEGLTKDDIIGDMLHAGVLSYFAVNDVNLKMVNRNGKALSYRLPSFGTFSTSLKPTYFFGIPQRVKMAGIRVNIDFLNKTLWATDNNRETTIALTRQIGMMASAWEHRIPEMLFTNEEHPGEAVSAVKALAVAAKEGQKIYTVTAENVNSVLPVLNVRTDVKDDIRDAVAVGKVAVVSQNQITISGWTGVGYIIADPETGTGAYMISGGSNGGFLEAYEGMSGTISWMLILISAIAAVTTITASVTIMITAMLFFHVFINLLNADLKLIEHGCPEFISSVLWGLTTAFFFLPKILKNSLANFVISLYAKMLGVIPASASLCLAKK